MTDYIGALRSDSARAYGGVQEVADGVVSTSPQEGIQTMLSRRAFLKVATMAAGAAFLPSWIREPAHAYTLPTGYMMLTTGDHAPRGWLPCHGQRVSREDYPELYRVIGTTYGDLDLSRRTFALPDMRRRISTPYYGEGYARTDRLPFITTSAWIKT